MRDLNLDGWRPEYDLPDKVAANPALIDTAITRFDIACSPASDKQFAVLAAQLVKFGRAFNIDVPDVSSVTAFYHDAFFAVPADLTTIAFTRARASWKWGNRLPLPADLLAQIAPELSERQSILSTLMTAKRKAQRIAAENKRRREYADEQIAEAARKSGKTVERYKADALAKSAALSAKKTTEDLTEPTPEERQKIIAGFEAAAAENPPQNPPP